MIIISHRGNIYGPSTHGVENKESYINDALNLGYDVEIDVWLNKKGKLMMGHDEPLHDFPTKYLENSHLWFHCKNAGALEYFSKLSNPTSRKYFWHQHDAYTLVSNGKIWMYPGSVIIPGAISVLPEISYYTSNYENLKQCYAVCTDYAHSYKKQLMNCEGW